MRRLSIFVWVAIFVPASAVAGDPVFERLVTAKCLKCELGPGASADWKSGKVNVKPDEWETTLIFDSIDLKAQKARIIGDQGASNVFGFLTAAGITFVEETGFGNINITTVFSEYAEGTMDFIVVHSRHMVLPTGPLPSQFHDTCKVWQ